MRQQHLISLETYSRADIEELLALAAKIKADARDYRDALAGRTLALLFEKPSTRTRVSFEAGMFQLGGSAMFLDADSLQLHRGEPVADTARVLSRYVDGIVARVCSHETVLTLAAHASVPVINGLSDRLHPCQALADFLTLQERRGRLDGLTLAYVGDGNNVCHELMLGAAKLGMKMRVATPKGFEPDPEITASAAREARLVGGAPPELSHDALGAAEGADAVYTDVWVSMGQEQEAETRRRAFDGFSVTAEMMSRTAPEGVFMHCLPAHRGEEVAAEVIDGPRSIVFDQAENRLHAQKALLVLLLGAGKSGE
jgi:ornithine carbamoyltransferase